MSASTEGGLEQFKKDVQENMEREADAKCERRRSRAGHEGACWTPTLSMLPKALQHQEQHSLQR